MSEWPASRSRVDPFDRILHANENRLTGGISPAAAILAYLDWAVHLANSPGKQAELVQKALRKSIKFNVYLAHLALCAADKEKDGEKNSTICIEPLPQDRRFRAPQWRQMPYVAWSQSFLLLQQWWHNATLGVVGVSEHHQNVVAFSARQLLDAFSPSNFAITNPEVLTTTAQQGGMNLVRGFQHFLEDWKRAVLQEPPVGAHKFRVGKEVAITPGKVVYRNRLIELIQYAPTTETVHPEPILIVPAWIMKYYILDLSPDNSMVKYLVDQGYSVFMISWKNPHEKDRNLTMDDYLQYGIMQALEAVRAIVPQRQVHALGYCLGGTLLAIAAAVLDRDARDWLKSLTLCAAQTDFTEAGELMLFIDQSQVAYLEDLMWDQGYLDAKQMVGTFQLLRSNDLIWSRMVHEYLMGERTPMSDLMAWNADATRMPFCMHSEYLRRLFLKNDLAAGRYTVGGKPAALTDIHAPIFAVGTERDHVAPWKSVYKINLFSDTDVTFLLTSGGHNAGIISEPGHPRRHHRIATRHDGEPYIAPDEWFASTKERDGSWWPAWQAWLAGHSGARLAPPAMGGGKSEFAPLCDAPGTYVIEK